MLAVPSYFLALLLFFPSLFFLGTWHSQCQVIFMRLLHFLKLCPKKPKRCLLSRDGNPSPKLLTTSLCHFLSPEIGFCMRKVSVISIASMPPCFSIYAGTCLYFMGKLGRQVGFVCRQGCCPLVQAAFVHLVSTLTPGVSIAFGRLSAVLGIELAGNRNWLLQSILSYKALFLNRSNCHVTYTATSHTAGEPFATNLLKSVFSGSEFILGLC